MLKFSFGIHPSLLIRLSSPLYTNRPAFQLVVYNAMAMKPFPSRRRRRAPVKSQRFRITLTELLWALIGLLLTIGGTLLKASTTGVPWTWANGQVPLHFLGVSYQIGAVMLVGCLGGRNAAVMSQIAYLALGLAGFQVFSQGGGMKYLTEPSFGYLLGFVPAAWLCGYIAFKAPPRLESLAFSGLCGVIVVHIVGIAYLMLSYLLKWIDAASMPFTKALMTYSVNLLPGQLAVICAIAVLAYCLRRVMFY